MKFSLFQLETAGRNFATGKLGGRAIVTRKRGAPASPARQGGYHTMPRCSSGSVYLRPFIHSALASPNKPEARVSGFAWLCGKACRPGLLSKAWVGSFGSG